MVRTAKLIDWLNDWLVPGNSCFAKRLSGNDTLANGAHQAGPYIPKKLLFQAFPSLDDENQRNPDCEFDAFIDSQGEHRRVRAIWYNNRLFGGSRDETRVTRWGGASSPILHPDATGSLVVFVFTASSSGCPATLRVWLAGGPAEEDLIEDRLSPVEPGTTVSWHQTASQEILALDISKPAGEADCSLGAEELPPDWLAHFPPAIDIIHKVCQLRPLSGISADIRLIKRRACEYQLFQSVEEAIESNRINKRFASVADFVATAQSILQRRKARSGRSLELHTRAILIEDGFRENHDFSHQPESEAGKRPDFIFPSEAAYQDQSFPNGCLRMLATKTTCKDRWRQVINEADRISEKHLLTLQEGVSVNQHREMRAAGVRLVVPTGLRHHYPEEIRPELVTFDDFLGQVQPR